MTLAVVQSFSVSLLQAMHNVSFKQASATLTAYMLCGWFSMTFYGAALVLLLAVGAAIGVGRRTTARLQAA